MPAEADRIDFDALWDYGNPAATESRFLEVLAQVEATASADYLAQLETQIARTHGLRAEFDSAAKWLDRADFRCGAAEARGEDVRTARVRWLLERGRCLNSSGRPADSVPLFEQALTDAEAAGLENLAVDAAHMLGIAVPGAGGLDWNLRAIAMAEAAAEPRARRWLGSLYNNTGWSLHDLGRFDEALALFEKSLDFRLAQGVVKPSRIARWCVARCLRSLSRNDEALTRQLALRDDYAATGEDSGYVHEELGELYLLAGRSDEARAEFAVAARLLCQDPLFARNEAARLERLRTLGQ
jgi:tetratricopeptide (TPR) repeat protein